MFEQFFSNIYLVAAVAIIPGVIIGLTLVHFLKKEEAKKKKNQ